MLPLDPDADELWIDGEVRNDVEQISVLSTLPSPSLSQAYGRDADPTTKRSAAPERGQFGPLIIALRDE